MTTDVARDARAARTRELAGLSHDPDEALDRLTRVVQQQLGVPVALVSLVTADAQLFPGMAGLDGWAGEARQTPLSHSFCQHVVRRQGPLVVTDARLDPLVQHNLAVDDLGVVAYLGMPLTVDGKTMLGSLCAIDTEPRSWSTQEVAALADLAALCSAELASRLDAEARAELLEAAAPYQVRQLRAVLDSIPAMVAYWDSDLRNGVANDAYLEWFGKTPAEVVGRHAREVAGPELFGQAEQHMLAALRGERRDFVRRIPDAQGRVRHAQTSYIPDVAPDGTVRGFFAHVFDVTELTEAAQFNDAVLAASPDPIYVMDLATGAMEWASRASTDLLGYDLETLAALGDQIGPELLHPDDLPALVVAHRNARHLADGETIEMRLRARHADGSLRWLLRRITPFERDEDGTVLRVLGYTSDIHDSVVLTDRLAAAALHDDLTGLPNRRLLLDRLTQALARQERHSGPVPVLYCDLDGFKRVNDTGGHGAGDAVLQAVADRLTGLLRPSDTVARLSGDEFCVVLEPEHDRVSASDLPEIELAQAVAERICAVVSEPVEVDGREYHVTASVGIAMARSGDDAEGILRDADAAMYRAKGRGKARSELFDSSLRERADDHLRVSDALRQALTSPAVRASVPTDDRPGDVGARIWVEYQPIYDTDTGAVLGVEALARMHDSHLAAVSPARFVPVAEEIGLIGELGRLVLDTACLDVASWRRDLPGAARLGLSVNISARQAGHSALVGDVREALERAGLPPEALTLELTESVLLDAGRSTMGALRALREDGVGIAIDDFGTGYASLRYLAELPVTSVKIDMSFTRGLPSDPVCTSIVRAVSTLAADLEISCVVEGVETADQLAALPAGVHAQGFLLGRPTLPAGVLHLLTAMEPSVEVSGVPTMPRR